MRIYINVRSFIKKIVLSLYSHRPKIKNILFRNIFRRILYLFIHNFLKMRLYYFKEVINIKHVPFL